jgi:diadenosine tetraphosphatase ApaH/serine/threonine PP2A family protein phosphatase
MSPLALLYDIHGNQPALEAVLDDARAAGADRFLLGGDYALFGPFPRETVATLRALSAPSWIRGNVDRWSANPDEAPDDELVQGAIAACRETLGAQLIQELGALPEQIVASGTRYCHASPASDLRSFLPEPAEEEDELLDGVSERRVVFGHTHLPFARMSSRGIELVNPGSVGMPFDGDPRAAYALVHEDGRLERRRVAYDHGASAAAVVERFGGAAWARRSAERLRSARA